MAREPRVRITGEGGVGSRARVYVGDQMLTNCQRVELVLDAKKVTQAVLHLVDVDVDVEVFSEDTVVMVQPSEQPTNVTVRMDGRMKLTGADGREIVRELRRLGREGGMGVAG